MIGLGYKSEISVLSELRVLSMCKCIPEKHKKLLTSKHRCQCNINAK